MRLWLPLLLLLGSLHAAKDSFVGVIATTNSYGYTYFYTFGATVSLAHFRLDADPYKGAAFYVREFSINKNIGWHIGGGAGTFWAITDTWALRFPLGLRYSFGTFDVMAEYQPSFALLSSAQIANLGYSDIINFGLRLRF